jgi:ankyrin repeat protein
MLSTDDADDAQQENSLTTPILLSAGHLALESIAPNDEEEKSDKIPPYCLDGIKNRLGLFSSKIFSPAKEGEAVVLDTRHPLCIASEKGNVEEARRILNEGDAQVDELITMENNTPLLLACKNGHVELVRLLLANGANVSQVSGNHGFTPLLIACEKGHVHVVRLLLEAGADCNQPKGTDKLSYTPIQIAQAVH